MGENAQGQQKVNTGFVPQATHGYGEGPPSCGGAQSRKLTESEVEGIAAVCHEANRTYSRFWLADDSQLPWDSAPDWQRDGVKAGVRDALEKANMLSLYASADAEDRHNSWMEARLRDGWRYAPLKNPVEKTHPCLLPYRSLPPEERRKDVLFGAICSALTPFRGV